MKCGRECPGLALSQRILKIDLCAAATGQKKNFYFHVVASWLGALFLSRGGEADLLACSQARQRPMEPGPGQTGAAVSSTVP